LGIKTYHNKIAPQAENLIEKVKEKESPVDSSFGLCSKCSNFEYTKSQLGTEKWACGNYHSRNGIAIFYPNNSDPIMTCSDFHQKGQISLDLMWNIATFIDVEKKVIGFDLSEQKEVKSYKLTEEELISEY